jgi:tetratricopeptide (TPR) repeat protein
LGSKKDKLLETAQKFIAKGQLDRAIREYEQIVALDSEDIRQRQKLAELLVRVNRKEQAIAEYEIIGKHYYKNVFYLKAIAIYNQIQKLDPTKIDTNLSLASLYEKQGLISNALSEYNLVVNHFQKAGSLPEVLKILEMMLAADPENPNTHLRFAETYFLAGHADKAYLEFMQLALLLRKSGDESAFDRVCERVQTLFPNNKDFILDVLTTQIGEGGTATAIPYLQELVNHDKTNLKAWKLLADAYLKTRETGNRRLTLQNIFDLFPDELFALEALIQSFLDEGDIDATLDMLKEHETHFARQNAFHSLERFYTALRGKAPDDIRILRGLRNVYEAAEEREKLAELVAVMDSLEPAREEPADRPETAHAETGPEITDEPAAATPMGGAEETVWEEEIDLSLAEEEGLGNLQDDVGNHDFPPHDVMEPAESKPFHGEQGSAIEEDWTEIDLEIGDTDISNNEWLRDIEHKGAIDFAGKESGSAGEIGELPGADKGPIPEKPADAPLSAEKQENGQIVEFKRVVVDQQLEKEDTETHYNLGIAYKEMELFTDAITEFQTAAMDPQRKIDCLTLEGICYRDKGDIAKAEEIFINTLSLQGLTGEEQLSLNYELAFLYETVGRQEDALRFYRQVRAINPGFRDAAKKIAHLQGSDDTDEMELLELDVEEFD